MARYPFLYMFAAFSFLFQDAAAVQREESFNRKPRSHALLHFDGDILVPFVQQTHYRSGLELLNRAIFNIFISVCFL